MKVKVIEENRKKMGNLSHVDLLRNKIYEAVPEKIKNNDKLLMYRIVDESGEDYLYPPMLFEVVED